MCSGSIAYDNVGFEYGTLIEAGALVFTVLVMGSLAFSGYTTCRKPSKETQETVRSKHYQESVTHVAPPLPRFLKCQHFLERHFLPQLGRWCLAVRSRPVWRDNRPGREKSSGVTWHLARAWKKGLKTQIEQNLFIDSYTYYDITNYRYINFICARDRS